jgi:hypothetical protein
MLDDRYITPDEIRERRKAKQKFFSLGAVLGFLWGAVYFK